MRKSGLGSPKRCDAVPGWWGQQRRGKRIVQGLLSFGSSRSSCGVPQHPADPRCGQCYKPAFSFFMGAWEAGAAADQEHRAPTALNAACVSAATDNEPFEGARSSTAVTALSASTGSGEKQAADSMPRGPRSQDPILQTWGHLPPQPCCHSVAPPSVPGYVG